MSIPERRSAQGKKSNKEPKLSEKKEINKLPLPVWRCKVCGYLCARDAPPEICPICKVSKERFERFI